MRFERAKNLMNKAYQDFAKKEELWPIDLLSISLGVLISIMVGVDMEVQRASDIFEWCEDSYLSYLKGQNNG